MARKSLASLDDLATRLGEDIANEDQAQARLEDASVIVRAYAGMSWLDEEGELSEVPEDIPGIVANMVIRASQNPGGVTSESAGPYSRSFGADAAQRLFLTAMEKLVIRNAAGKNGIGTLCTTRGPLETPAVTDCWADELEEVVWPS